MPRRTPETLADYVVVGIAPMLIMLLVGSLVFFLIGVFYQGDFPYRLTWVMGLFVLATVCVARISMEEGAGYAALFGLPLGVVVGIAVVYFVEIKGPLAPFSALINWSLLALIWWCAHQLTWDCTLIDDRRDTTGQGLLQSMGWAAAQEVRAEPGGNGVPPESTSVAAGDAQRDQLPWWQRLFGHRDQPAAHGRWVVYFSVAALPLFGLGQYFIPVEDVAGRRYAFWMLVVYVGSGLGLLLTTSFLGLRRYIRQRQLEMPVEMAATWLSVGVVMILGLLIAAALLPRPAPEYSIAESLQARLGSFNSPDRSASQAGIGPEGTDSQEGGDAKGEASAAKDKARDDHQAQAQNGAGQSASSENDQSNSQSGPNGNHEKGTAADSNKQSSGKEAGSNGSQQSKGGESGGKKADEAASQSSPEGSGDQLKGKRSSQGDAPNEPGTDASNGSKTAETQTSGRGPSKNPDGGEQQTEATTNPSPPRPPLISQFAANLGNLLRLIFYTVLAIAAALLAWKYRRELAAAWRQLLRELSELWNRLFGRSAAKSDPLLETEPRKVVKAFREYADPFASGIAQRMTPAQLVQYSFDALQAWARDFAVPRESGQTPHEFSEALALQQPNIDVPARQLAEIYGRMAYARQSPPTQTVTILQALWRAMNQVAERRIIAGTADKPVGSV